MTDEDKMIKKLEEHRDGIKLIVEIGELNDVEVVPTTGNDSSGDFTYPLEDEEKLINAIDKYLGHRKYIREKADEE
ncbi:hypothetical protein KHM83_11080 [Fusibacter paucivorans]|uniref:Uncharacterized protein n=1 Tax=Fusibacter paucivorans TaxID=76009 RepID=A0ABS5PS40_9FIRM|nr:hypothetical protein [Fusibacter paucivorans]MBS7527224.1 hypothetical protein [Fusibacter paucivorans]